RAFPKTLPPPKRVNNFLAGHNQGFYPISICGFSPLGPSGLRMGVNSDQALSASYGGNANFNSNFGYGQDLNHYYSGPSSRYSSSFDNNWGEGAIRYVLTSTTTNMWGNGGGMSSSTNSSCSNAAYLGPGSGCIGTAAGANCFSSPLCAQTEGSTSSYITGSPSYRDGGNNYGFQGGRYARNTKTFKDALLYGTSNAVPQVESESIYGGGSFIFGNSIWRSTDSDNISDSFGHGLSGVASDGRDNNYGFEGGGIGRNSETSEDTPVYGTSNGVPEGELKNFYGGGSICGNSLWWSTDSDDISNSFGYGLGDVASDVVTKSSAGFVRGYSDTDRQVNR
ncbi:hypothetical protein MKX01_039811, partial [Papaver californicum]